MSWSVPLNYRYYAYQVTLSLGFYVPVSVVYLLDQGFDLGFVGLTWAVFSFSLLLAEIPTGYLGDRLGRRWTLVFGTVCRIVGIGGYVVADAGVTFLVLKVFTGVGWALRSGTSDAYLYELLRVEYDESQFARVKGYGKGFQLTTSAVTALAGGVLYGVDPRIPFVATAILAALGVPTLLSLPAVSGEGGSAFSARDAVDAMARQVRRPELRWVVVYCGLILLSFDLTRTFEQPALQSVGFTATQLGGLYAGFKLVSAVGGYAVGTLQSRLGTRGVLAALAPVVGAFYAGTLAWPILVVPTAFAYRFARTLLVPVRNQYLNDRLDDVGRATVLSGVSMLLSLAGGLARLVGGRVVDVVGPVSLIGLAGALLTVVAGAVWLGASPVRPMGVDGEVSTATSD